MAIQTVPTKGNLLATKKSLELARVGFELLDRKRNILIREMMMLIDKAEEIQNRIDSTYHNAYQALQRANITLGICEEIAQTVPLDDGLSISFRSVMGVEIPTVLQESEKAGIPFGLMQTNADLDKAYLAFDEVKRLTASLASVENSVYRLADAIKKTQKRANALKNIIIPRFESTVKFISDALEEKDGKGQGRILPSEGDKKPKGDKEPFIRIKKIKKEGTSLPFSYSILMVLLSWIQPYSAGTTGTKRKYAFNFLEGTVWKQQISRRCCQGHWRPVHFRVRRGSNDLRLGAGDNSGIIGGNHPASRGHSEEGFFVPLAVEEFLHQREIAVQQGIIPVVKIGGLLGELLMFRIVKKRHFYVSGVLIAFGPSIHIFQKVFQIFFIISLFPVEGNLPLAGSLTGHVGIFDPACRIPETTGQGVEVFQIPLL